jgi:hypothetical protein
MCEISIWIIINQWEVLRDENFRQKVVQPEERSGSVPFLRLSPSSRRPLAAASRQLTWRFDVVTGSGVDDSRAVVPSGGLPDSFRH